MQEKVQRILAELRCQFEEFYGERLVQLVLYGSQARGDADPESDIDVLVVLRGPVNPYAEIRHSGHLTASLSLEHDVVISSLFVSEAEYLNEQSSFLFNVHKEGILV